MKLLESARSLLSISSAHGIVRRYFVVNGFDGALTMLGLIIGFSLGDPAELSIIINVCLGAAIALSVSGISSAYVSETAERQRALLQLEHAMLTDLADSSHGVAARWVPIVIALANGAAPLLLSLLIITPLWLEEAGIHLPVAPLHAAISMALMIAFLLGAYLGRVAGVSWFKSGMRTLAIALITAGLIFAFVDG